MKILVLTRLSREIITEELLALECAKKIKDKLNAKVSVLAMDTDNNINNYKKCFTYGVDDIYLLSDMDFSGADILATSKTISSSIKKIGIKYDIILSNAYSNYGETGQVPITVANLLGIEYANNVLDLNIEDDCKVFVKENMKGFVQQSEIPFPCLISLYLGFEKEKESNYKPNLFDILKSNSKEIIVYSNKQLHIDCSECGTLGSYTKVVDSKKIERIKESKIISNDIDAINILIDNIRMVRENEKNINSI